MATDGSQFMHIECYARKTDAKGRSVAYVLGEAARRPEACLHIQNPRPPELVYGVPLDHLWAVHDARAEETRVVVAGGRTRRIRSDQHTLLTIVVSHPAMLADVQRGTVLAADVDAWERLAVDWLRAQWGDDLTTVVRHTDEEHPHLHAYVLPSDGSMRAWRLHPGNAAKEAVKNEQTAAGCDAKTANAIGDRAYVVAMRALQDDFHRIVGIPSALARLGPGRRRLTRAQWQAEKAAARAAAEAIHAAEATQSVAEKAKADAATILEMAGERAAAADALQAKANVARARATAAVVAAEETVRQATVAANIASKRREAAERHVAGLKARARTIIEKAHQEARQLLDQTTMEAHQLRRRAHGFGVWVGSWLQGFRGTAPHVVALEVAARVRTEERQHAAVIVADARADAAKAREALRETEDRLASASASAAALGRQRDRLAQQLDLATRARTADTGPALVLTKR